VFERSKIPLHKWILATHLLCSSKKGMSSHQLHRTLGVTYKTAWFMTHRIREAMKTEPTGKLGGNGGIVEIDETFVGRKPGSKKRAGYGHKEPVFSLVERNGNVRSFHVCDVKANTLRPILNDQIDKNTHIMTDDAVQYPKICQPFKAHSSVNHSAGEYSRGKAHTNTVEGYFSILKRGIIGTYHHVSSHHLNRYVNEFDFRYNNRKVTDTERATSTLKGIDGKRLTYRQHYYSET
jgi:transposase-like protein